MDAEGFRTAIASEKTSHRQIRTFATMLATATGLGAEGLTVVGGSALEVYTEGDYVSDDVDLVAKDRGRVVEVLRSWGFRQDGMYWVSADFRPSVQIVGKYDSGSRRLSQIVSTRYGRVRLVAVEEIVVKRLIEARHWRRADALAEAMLAVERYGATMDWEYVERRAEKYGVEDLVAQVRRRAGLTSAKGEPSD